MPSFSSSIIEQNPVQMSLDEALEQVEENANQFWFNACLRTVRQISERHEEFTTDLVWERMEKLPFFTNENRAMGAIMRKAAKSGWIEPTGNYEQSKRPECHRRPVAIWRSCLYSLPSDL